MDWFSNGKGIVRDGITLWTGLLGAKACKRRYYLMDWFSNSKGIVRDGITL